jgi:Fic family protein
MIDFSIMMNSFSAGLIEKQAISQTLLQTIRLLGEFKGKQELFEEQSPQVLDSLRQASIIQSSESSNRLEGITAPHERIAGLVDKRLDPKNRPEQEIAGYRDALDTIHTNNQSIPFSTNTVLQIHRDLYKFSSGVGGRWKSLDNEITETLPNGTKLLRFKPVSADETPKAMEALHRDGSQLWASGRIDPLLLIPTYVLDFLCIHPFLDGNGRTARMLTLLLLYKAGYRVGRFISLERVVETTKDSYYKTLYQSSQLWHEGQHNLAPWWEYFLGVMLLAAYREFADRVGAITATRGAKREMILDVVSRLPHEFRFADVQRACPGVSRPTVNRALAELRKAGKIRCPKAGRDAVWNKLA